MSVTVGQVYRQGRERLENAGFETADFDARLLAEKAFELKPKGVIRHSRRPVSDRMLAHFNELVDRRMANEPLQYILGTWEFMSMELSVGEGVLIPRPETEMLVPTVLQVLNGRKEPVVYDLCAGSGCIGLAVAKLCPEARVYLIEKTPEAYFYLRENIKRLKLANTFPIRGDITQGAGAFNLPGADVIVSNPPYVKTSELPELQSEVKSEPSVALDGGEDGLDFYRFIAGGWCDSIKEDGALVLECDGDQGELIMPLFAGKFKRIYAERDFNMIERMLVMHSLK